MVGLGLGLGLGGRKEEKKKRLPVLRYYIRDNMSITVLSGHIQ